MQTIYFDAEDEKRDGNGWNVIALFDEDSVAVRFTTLENAEKWCIKNKFTFII